MKKGKSFIIVLGLVLVVSIGYAFLSSNLRISGVFGYKKNKWDVHFENIIVSSGSVESSDINIGEDETSVYFSVTFSSPGEYYDFYIDAVNDGTIDAMINNITISDKLLKYENYLTYTLEYFDGNEVNIKDLLKKNSKSKLHVRIEYNYDVEEVASVGEQEFSFEIEYLKSDETAVEVVHPVCIRATTLHTEVCNQTSTSYYCSGGGYETGSTVTYGNLGTAGILNSGDAFDCDVNGDGTYDQSTERFYYVSDLDTDSKYAVLIYYSNVTRGVADSNTKPYAYNTITDDSAIEYEGPTIVINQLPTTEQWNNVNLNNEKRSIKDENGVERVLVFSYAGVAARLLTIQELSNACGSNSIISTGYLDNCKYLMENTKYANDSRLYGYWLESVSSTSARYSLNVFSTRRVVAYSSGGNVFDNGIRPVIEVPKSKISL